MSKSYTPGLKVQENTAITKERLLPLKGEVLVNNGDVVDAKQVVASTEIPGNVQMINIANELNIDPDQVSESMLVSVDEKINKGDIIARSKGLFGLFKSEVVSPLTGTLGSVSDITGQAVICETPIPVEVDAYISGKISKVIPNEGVEIDSNGTLIQGIIGIGGEKKGFIELLDEELSGTQLTKEKLGDELKDKIVVTSSYLSYDVYQEANRIGVKGIICSAIDYETLSKILGHPLGVAITGMEDTTTIIVTEAFGQIDMATKTFNLLKKNNGLYASINGATQIRAGVMRPEIFIKNRDENSSSQVFNEESLIISVGSKVRVIREPNFGKLGTVSALPHELCMMKTETKVRVAEVTFDDGQKETIPRTNLEVIISE